MNIEKSVHKKETSKKKNEKFDTYDKIGKKSGDSEKSKKEKEYVSTVVEKVVKSVIDSGKSEA